jgi:WD40 repeat protein
MAVLFWCSSRVVSTVQLVFLIILCGASSAQAATARLIIQNSHHGTVRDMAFSADEALLATASWDGTVGIWDTRSGELVRTYSDTGPSGADNGPSSRFPPVQTVAFDPVKKLVASGGRDGVKIWDPANGRTLRSLTLPYVNQIAFTPDGSTLLLATERGVFLWFLAAGDHATSLLDNTQAKSIAVSSDGDLAAAGGVVFDLKSKKIVRAIDTADAWTWAVAFVPGKRRIVTGGQSVVTWDIDSGRQISKINIGFHVWHLSLDQHGNVLVTTTGKVCIYSLLTARQTLCLDATTSDFGAAIYSRDALMIGVSATIPRIFKYVSGAFLEQKHYNSLPTPFIAAFSQDGRKLFLGGDSLSRIIDLERNTQTWSGSDLTAWDKNQYAFSPDSKEFFYTIDSEPAIGVIDIDRGAERAHLVASGHLYTHIDFVGTTNKIAAGATNGSIDLFDLDRRELVATTSIGSSSIGALSASFATNTF